MLQQPWVWGGSNFFTRSMGAFCEMLGRAGMSHTRPPFGIDSVQGRRQGSGGHRGSDLSHAVLLVAPFQKGCRCPSSRACCCRTHVGALSRHCCAARCGTLVADHDLYITDWENARNVSLVDGRFDLDDFIDHIVDFLHVLGPGAHVVAVCQPSVPVLAAVSLMAQDQDPAQPRSIDADGRPRSTHGSIRPRSICWPRRDRMNGSSAM
ncbi:MAG: hypothetical protein WDN69_17545 [Aliidongia sp.]